jgi:hypothetical protein
LVNTHFVYDLVPGAYQSSPALLVALRAFQVRGGQLDYGEYVEPAARQVASVAKSVARQGNKVLAGEKNVRDWEPPINRWQNAYTTEEWVYY